jgi:Zn-dependent protease
VLSSLEGFSVPQRPFDPASPKVYIPGMKWSLRIGKLFGIPVYIHLTFLLFLVWVGFVGWGGGEGIHGIEGVLFVSAIFLCVVLHELGHALTARRYGIATRDITLLPIGGVARLERMPDDPRQELRVALAGPAVNAVIAVVLIGLARVVPAIPDFDLTHGSFLDRLIATNIFLVLFNLLPAFPMDGGRVLRALLATRMEYTRATQRAATIGQMMALLLGFWGLVQQNPIVVFIALFVWIGAAQEAGMVQMRHWLSGVPVSQAMVTTFTTLAPNDVLAKAIDMTLTGSQRDFPVVQDGSVVGILLQADLLKALAHEGPGVLVKDVMQTDFEVVQASEMLDTAFRRLSVRKCSTAPVSSQGRLVGMVTMDNIGEFLAIHGALERTHRTA